MNTNNSNEAQEIHAELIHDEDVLKVRNQSIDDELHNLSIIHPYGYTLPERYVQYHQRIQEFDILDDDVFIATHQKCGTTWMTELVWRVRNDPEFKETKASLKERVPFLEDHMI
uniref:Sulfotransferase domain-containing protein n=1 Tax=Clytia hemisphaerica TaxID=252671 RepID=A0A7M5UNK0_9CNID